MTHHPVAVLAAAAAIATSNAGAVSHQDARGDAGSAPDITSVSVEPSGSSLAFRISFVEPGAPLDGGGELFLALDAGATGDQHGVDHVYSLRAGGAELRARRWTGSEHAPFASTATARLEPGAATFVVDLAELGSPEVIGYGAVGARGSDLDAAPENGSWQLRLREAVRVSAVNASWSPRRPTAGRPFRVVAASATMSDGTQRRGTFTCSARLAGRMLGAGGCRWRMPSGARGKRLTVQLRIELDGAAATKVLRLRVA
jgi:hypothetical protein